MHGMQECACRACLAAFVFRTGGILWVLVPHEGNQAVQDRGIFRCARVGKMDKRRSQKEAKQHNPADNLATRRCAGLNHVMAGHIMTSRMVCGIHAGHPDTG